MQKRMKNESYVPQALEGCDAVISSPFLLRLRPANKGLSFTSKQRVAPLSLRKGGLSTSSVSLNAGDPRFRRMQVASKRMA